MSYGSSKRAAFGVNGRRSVVAVVSVNSWMLIGNVSRIFLKKHMARDAPRLEPRFLRFPSLLSPPRRSQLSKKIR
jgi:hypothetical protein